MHGRKRILVLAGAALVVLGAAGGVLAAGVIGSSSDLEALESATREAPLVRLADIAAGNAQPARGVFAQITSTGEFCLWDAPSRSSRQRQGGCNPADEPLAGHHLSASLAYEGGPGAASVTDARLIGLVSADVARVQVELRDGSRWTLTLHDVPRFLGEFRAFAYRFGRGEITRGGPVAVVALDASGVEIDRQDTGF